MTRMVLSESMLLVAIGAVVGIPAALLAAPLLKDRLFGVHAFDLSSILIAVVAMALTAGVAAAVIRASRASVVCRRSARSDPRSPPGYSVRRLAAMCSWQPAAANGMSVAQYGHPLVVGADAAGGLCSLLTSRTNKNTAAAMMTNEISVLMNAP